MTPADVSTLVLAGARQGGDALAQAHGVASKAGIVVQGQTMLGRVLEAVSGSAVSDTIAVSGLDEEMCQTINEPWPEFVSLAGKAGPAASVESAMASRQLSYPILVTTCDHALLTPEIIDTFVTTALAKPCDLAVGLAERHVVEGAYPDVARTYFQLRHGAYSGCNLFLLRTPACLDVVDFWRRAEDDRKQPWRIARRFGLVSALRVWRRRVDLRETFEIVSNRLSCHIRPVLLPFADAAVDVDKPSDLALVSRVLEARQA